MSSTARGGGRYAAAVVAALSVDGPIVMAAPLGLGKPNGLINAIYRAVAADGQRPMRIFTALSLTPPHPTSDLERRFLEPFLARQFGEDYPVLEYVAAQKSGTLPANIRVHEFYLQSGALLDCAAAQQDYISLNYTHVARAVADRGVNVVVQLLARDPASGRLSFSCNPDVTLDLLAAIKASGRQTPVLLGEVHPDLPFMPGPAEVPEGLFDVVVEPAARSHRLFGLPRQPVSDAEYAIGFLGSTLVRDGGSLQIGIGALSDALTHALVLRQTRNEDYREIVRALWPEVETSPLVCDWGGLGEFQRGLFGASEMVMDGFTHLIDVGVIKRPVVDDLAVMGRVHDGTASEEDVALLEREGQILHGGFFLGSHALYDWLRSRTPKQLGRIGMTRISHINELYGGQESLERFQRSEARFFNTCMMTTVLGAAVSDGLADGRVVSGVGGQYNFVAMAHALEESRSILMFRAVRDTPHGATSNVVASYPHITIPRHLRDVAITEYGIADLRDRSDAECIQSMLSICDARFEGALRAGMVRAGKLAEGMPAHAARNLPERIREILAPFRASGLLPDYPLGSDFTACEQRLVRALGWLKNAAAQGKPALIGRALLQGHSDDDEAMARMGLQQPRGWREKLTAKLVTLALRETQ
ncbi:MAG: acetyl-CoA hydrolase [Xanthomonadales bacterium]|nr:acetyl-CoA hydrolase [Xanthomonadales bacterium]